MKKILLLIFTISLFTSCTDSMDINDIQSDSRLVMYCFPSCGDTTIIQLSRSIPVNNSTFGASVAVNSANISYKINGTQIPVHLHKASDNYQYTDTESSSLYYAIGKHAVGDKIEIQASATDTRSVSSSTTIPSMPIIGKIDTLNLQQGWNRYFMIHMTFTDDANTEDFYAVRVIERDIDKNDYSAPYDTSLYISAINTDEEPLLNKLSEVDTDFGFTDNYYHNFYIFNDKQINGSTYTMHLKINNNNYSNNRSTSYKLQFFKLTHEYYKFIKTLNNTNGNDLAEYGFSPVTPIFNNVKSGFGVMGGYNMVETQWYLCK